MTRQRLAAAFAYFSIFPVGGEAAGPADARLFAYLPVVGILIGGLAGTAAFGVSLIAPRSLSVATGFALSILLTGAIHVDGFLDCCDGLIASVPPQRRLEIIRDPHHGSFAIAYGAVAFTLWIAAIAALPPARLGMVLAFAAATSRVAAVSSGLFFPYARGGRPPVWLLLLQSLALIGFSFVGGPWMWACVPAAFLTSWAGAAWSARRLDGQLVGDVYGALIVVSEILVLLLVATLLHVGV